MSPGANPNGLQSAGGESVELGELYVPTGELYCCDPFLSFDVGPLERTVPPGSYRVWLALRDLPDFGRRVAAAALEISAEPPVRWEEAVYRVDGSRSSRFEVDAGLACFMDASTNRILVVTLDEFYDRYPEGNYYEARLAAEFARSADPSRGGHAGDWTMHHPVPGDPRNIALFASGLGDGFYSARWGLDARGSPALLMVHFGLPDA